MPPKKDPTAKKKGKGLGGAANATREAMNAVQERQRKMNETVLASAELADSAADFENVARLLAEREDKKWFGFSF